MKNHEQRRAWNVLGEEPTLRSVTLDDGAPLMSDDEIEEILEVIPQFAGKTVLELGAGIGRFTRLFAETAYSVTALDFSEGFIEKNQETTSHFSNVEHFCADVLEWAYPIGAYDFVFSNWLLMYLDDGDVRTLLRRVNSCLSNAGTAFFRESCLHPAFGGKKTTEELRTKVRDIVKVTNYRDPVFYEKAFEQASFAVIAQGNIRLYEKWFENKNQKFWVLKKHNSVRRGDG